MENQSKPSVRLIPAEEVIKDVQLASKVGAILGELKDESVRFPSLHLWDSLIGMNLYVIFDEDEGDPVGLIGWTGPVDEATPSWWVHPNYRKKGYGKRAVEKLAEEMHRKGVKQIGDIVVHTKTVREYLASGKLARRLKRHFKRLRG